MESRQEVGLDSSEFSRIVDLIIQENAKVRESGAVLEKLLHSYLQEQPVCSTLFAETQNVKLVKAMLLVLKNQDGDPVLALIWHLNSISQKIKSEWPIVLWLKAYFAVYQHYGVYFNEVCTTLFAAPDVWQARQQHYLSGIVADLQNVYEAISLAAFEVLLELRLLLPSAQQVVLVHAIIANLHVNARKLFKLAILRQASLIHAWLAHNESSQTIFLGNVLNNVSSEDDEICAAACDALILLSSVIAEDRSVEIIRELQLLYSENSLNQIIANKVRVTLWKFLPYIPITDREIILDDCVEGLDLEVMCAPACDALFLLSPVIAENQCIKIVQQLLRRINCKNQVTANSARRTLWKFLPHVPLGDREKIMDDCVDGLHSEEDVRFLAASNTIKFLDDAVPPDLQFKIVDTLCRNLSNKAASIERRLAGLKCMAGIMRSIPVNQHCEVITHICDIAVDKNLIVNLRQQAIATLKKLRLIYFVGDCKRVTTLLLTMVTDVREDIKVREEALTTLVELRERILFGNVNELVVSLLNSAAEIKRQYSTMFKIQMLKVLSCTVKKTHQDNYVRVKQYLLEVVQGSESDWLVKIQAVQELEQLAVLDWADEIQIVVQPFLDKLDEQLKNKNVRLVSSVCDLLRQLKPFLEHSEQVILLEYLLLQLRDDSYPSKIFSVIAAYIPEMSTNQKINALCVLDKIATLETSCHHEAKKLFIQIYHEYMKDLIASTLQHCGMGQRTYIVGGQEVGESQREYLPNYLGRHIIRLSH